MDNPAPPRMRLVLAPEKVGKPAAQVKATVKVTGNSRKKVERALSK